MEKLLEKLGYIYSEYLAYIIIGIATMGFFQAITRLKRYKSYERQPVAWLVWLMIIIVVIISLLWIGGSK